MALTEAKKADFDKVFNIMKISFPEEEYRSYSKQKELFNNPNYKIYILPNGEDILGFITIWNFDKFVFVEHLAISPEFRNLGLGSLILNELAEKFPCQICLEVELPQTQTAIKRIGFYMRNNFYLNDFEYYQPAYELGKKGIPLCLMSSKEPLNSNDFEHVKSTLYENVYGLQAKGLGQDD